MSKSIIVIDVLDRAAKAAINPYLVYKHILARIYEYKRNILIKKNFVYGSKTNAVVLASYPRSGNTFFRFVWMNVINDLENLNISQIDFDTIDKYLPNDQYFSDIRTEWPFSVLPCLLKTHRNYGEQFKNKRVIHLFRNPLDTMVSSYHYFSNRTGGPTDPGMSWLEKQCFDSIERYQGTFEEFLRENFDAYCSHFVSWMGREPIPLAYETIISEKSQQVFFDTLSKLGHEIPENVINIAVNNSRMEKVKKFTSSSKMVKLKEIPFVRDGSCEQWRDYFGENDLKFVKDKLKKYELNDLSFYPAEYRPHLNSWSILIC